MAKGKETGGVEQASENDFSKIRKDEAQKVAKTGDSKKSTAELFSLPVLAKKNGVPAWELAALMRAAGWAEGKMVGREAFEAALLKLRKRPMGGGRI